MRLPRCRLRDVRALAWVVVVATLHVMLAAASAGQATVTRERGPWMLTSVPSIGSVTWRCRTGASLSPRAYALGFKAFASSATDELSFYADGRRHERRTIQPGQSVAFPHLPSGQQRIEVVQRTEPRTLHATVTVTFKARTGFSYC